jgi:retinol dehydrogenase-12
MSALLGLLRNRWSAPSLASLSPGIIIGKTVCVTGASTGLGLEAARHYTQLGASRVILGVRSQSKGDAAKQNIIASLSETNHQTSTQIDVWTIDLASFASVQVFAKRVNEELDTLDIAVLNAAISKSEYVATKDGWDETLQVNMLSTTLLGLLILEKLEQSSKTHANWTSRLDFVASRSHQYVKDGAAWQSEGNILQALNKPNILNGTGERYGTSKLLLIYGAREISKLANLPDGGLRVIVNYTCPGACKSDLAREWREHWLRNFILLSIENTICKTTEEGSRTPVYATCLGEESHGKWIHNNRLEE